MSPRIAQVIPVRDFPTKTLGFDYLIPENHTVKVGQLCQISFRNTNVLGVVFAIKNVSDYSKLKTLTIIEDELFFSTAWLQTVVWFSKFYHYSFGSTIKLFFPKFGKKLNLKLSLKNTVATPVKASAKSFDNIKLDYKKGILFHANNRATINDYYLYIANKYLKLNKSVLIICPDQNSINNISVSLKDFPVVKLDSSLTDKQWREGWLSALSDDFKIVLVTQKGSMLPITNLGIILIDQENSSGQIQTERNPRFDCRLIAINYANNLKIPVVFTTLSPSIDSLNLVKQKLFDYHTVKLNERAPFVIVDQNTELVASKNMFGPIVEKEIKNSLSKNKSTFIFSFYHQPTKTYCLYCEKENPIQQNFCLYCRQLLTADKKSLAGIKDELRKINLTGESADKFNNDNKIYIGGLKHLSLIKDAGLVVIIDADNILNIPNFKSSEKLRHLIDQLNSCSDKLVVISKNCDHHCYKNNFLNFIKDEINIRKKYAYPPFGSVIHITSKQFNASEIEIFNNSVTTTYPNEPMNISGPYKDKANKNEYLIIKINSSNSLANLSDFMYSNWMLDRYPADLLK